MDISDLQRINNQLNPNSIIFDTGMSGFVTKQAERWKKIG